MIDMTNEFKDIESSALKLTDKQRAKLAVRLLESLDKEQESDVEQAWLEEIERRNQLLESGNAELIPAKDVFAKARNLIA